MEREIYKSIEIDGTTYVLRKFDAMTGMQLMRLLLVKAAPVLEAARKGWDADALTEAVVSSLAALSDEDITSIASKCLQFCYRQYPAGREAVLDSAGHYGDEDVEYDIKRALRLVGEAILWGGSDFF